MQFDVYRNPSSRMREQYPFVVDVQRDLLGSLATRMVVPLAITQLVSNDVPRNLCPVFHVQGQQLMLLPLEAAPIPKKNVENRCAIDQRSAGEIVDAMDAVMSGI